MSDIQLRSGYFSAMRRKVIPVNSFDFCIIVTEYDKKFYSKDYFLGSILEFSEFCWFSCRLILPA